MSGAENVSQLNFQDKPEEPEQENVVQLNFTAPVVEEQYEEYEEEEEEEEALAYVEEEEEEEEEALFNEEEENVVQLNFKEPEQPEQENVVELNFTAPEPVVSVVEEEEALYEEDDEEQYEEEEEEAVEEEEEEEEPVGHDPIVEEPGPEHHTEHRQHRDLAVLSTERWAVEEEEGELGEEEAVVSLSAPARRKAPAGKGVEHHHHHREKHHHREAHQQRTVIVDERDSHPNKHIKVWFGKHHRHEGDLYIAGLPACCFAFCFFLIVGLFEGLLLYAYLSTCFCVAGPCCFGRE